MPGYKSFLTRRYQVASALILLVLIAFGSFDKFADSERFLKSTIQMKTYTHTPRGFAFLIGGMALLSLTLNLIFVELWYRREKRKGKGSAGQAPLRITET